MYNYFIESPFSDRWMDHFQRHAEAASRSAKDATKIGAALIGEDKEVLLTAFNGPGLGVKDTPERRNLRPMKYNFACHAEQNLVAFSARKGIRTEGKTVYTTHFPCANCANTLIQAGIKAVIVKNGRDGNTTQIDNSSYEDASRSFNEAGVKLYSHEVDRDTERQRILVSLSHDGPGVIGRGSDFDHMEALSYLLPKSFRKSFWDTMEGFKPSDVITLREAINSKNLNTFAIQSINYTAWLIAMAWSEDVLLQQMPDDEATRQEAARRAYRILNKYDSEFYRSVKANVLTKQSPIVIPKYSFPVW